VWAAITNKCNTLKYTAYSINSRLYKFTAKYIRQLIDEMKVRPMNKKVQSILNVSVGLYGKLVC